jgi:hypothetical protein
MWTALRTTLAVAAMAAALASHEADAIKVKITNMCAEGFELSHLGKGTIISVENFPSGSTMAKELPMESHSQLFKAGRGAQATRTFLFPMRTSSDSLLQDTN